MDEKDLEGLTTVDVLDTDGRLVASYDVYTSQIYMTNIAKNIIEEGIDKEEDFLVAANKLADEICTNLEERSAADLVYLWANEKQVEDSIYVNPNDWVIFNFNKKWK